MKHWKPLFIENSKIPVWLSYLAPIDIGAITLGPVVISRGEMSEQTKRHETIHFQQYLELAFVGFLVMYAGFWIWNLMKGHSPRDAYYKIPFELEAYGNDVNENYLEERERYAWTYYTLY